MSHLQSPLDVPLTIVGAGPTGLTLAILLARRGVRSVLIERDAEPKRHPAAHVLNTRTMEVLREVGVEEEIRRTGQNCAEIAYIAWKTALAGRELGRRFALPTNAESMSPTQTVHFPQNRLEAMLWRKAQEFPIIDFRPSQTCCEVKQADDAVAAAIVDRRTNETYSLRSRYLAACDGAASPVRESLSIGMLGPLLRNMLGIHFQADLSPLITERRGVLYWIYNPQVAGALIGYWLPNDWVLNIPYFPPQQTVDDFTPYVCHELIRAALGTNEPQLQLQGVKSWQMTARMAETFRQGRIFLAGDAAHTIPPTGGLGLNTGVQDAHNLAWKFAAVMQGQASPALLDSYELERRPVAQENLNQSLRILRELNEITAVVGLNQRNQSRLVGLTQSRALGLLPRSWQKQLVAAIVKAGMRRFGALDDSGPRGDRVRRQLADRLPSVSLQARMGLDLGFVYRAGAVVRDVSGLASTSTLEYTPSTEAGARLPHFWVRRGSDLLPIHEACRRDGFCLLVHEPGKTDWQAAAIIVETEYSMPVACTSIGGTSTADLLDVAGVWPRLSQIEPEGALLVRPDGHVAWRCVRLPSSVVETLRSVLVRLLVLWRSPANDSLGSHGE